MGLKEKFENPATTTIHNGSLGVNGRPNAALSDPLTKKVNNTFVKGEYDTALPDGVDAKRALDTTQGTI